MNQYTEKQQLHLTSNGGVIKNSTLKSDVTFDLKGLFLNTQNVIYRTISVSNAVIPVSFYIVNEYNNKLNFNNATYNIPYGNYNGNTLLRQIQTTISNLIVLLDSATGKFTFQYNTSFTINGTLSTINKIIGIDKTTYNSTSNSFTCPYPINTSGTKNIHVKTSNLLLNNFNYSAGDRLTLTTISKEAGLYEIIYYENKSDLKNIIKNPFLSTIEIQIYDDDNNLIDFNNIDWSITLQIETTYNNFVLTQELTN